MDRVLRPGPAPRPLARAVIQTGFLLVASPALADPNFARTVSLICKHGDEGTYGVALNRPLHQTLHEIAPELDPRLADVPVFLGGPVQRELLQFLHPARVGGETVLDGVALGGGVDEIVGAGEPPGRVRGYLGYAGWDGGQLADEIREGAWFVAPAEPRHVFEVAPEVLWRLVLRELGGRHAWQGLGDDPGLN